MPEEAVDSVVSNITGLTLIPRFRVNGSEAAPPWNEPEGSLFEWLATANIEILEDRELLGENGVFWGRIRYGDAIKSAIVRFSGLGREAAVAAYGEEFTLDNGQVGLLIRDVSAYEVAKAVGCEDLSMPIALRDLNPVELLSDAARYRIAKKLRMSPSDVDNVIGIPGTIQMCPENMDNLAEKLPVLGLSTKEMWDFASDQLRFSLYRIYFLDFILGVPDRAVASIGYNSDTDKAVLVDMGLSFPHSGLSAEKYIQMRAKGWGRSSGGYGRFVDNTPPTAYDFGFLFQDLDEKHTDEAIAVAQQIAARMTDALASHLAVTCLEMGISEACVASMLLRIAFLAASPGSVIKSPIEYLRNLCVPMRAMTADGDMRVISASEYVNNIMRIATGEDFDIAAVIQQEAPAGSGMKI